MCFSSAQKGQNNFACLNVKQITALGDGILKSDKPGQIDPG